MYAIIMPTKETYLFLLSALSVSCSVQWECIHHFYRTRPERPFPGHHTVLLVSHPLHSIVLLYCHLHLGNIGNILTFHIQYLSRKWWQQFCLTLMASIMTAADDSLEYFFIVFFFSEKIRFDISCESSARQQRIHMKHQALFSSKDKHKRKWSVVCCNFAWLFKGFTPQPRYNMVGGSQTMDRVSQTNHVKMNVPKTDSEWLKPFLSMFIYL